MNTDKKWQQYTTLEIVGKRLKNYDEIQMQEHFLDPHNFVYVLCQLENGSQFY